jgi:hypothetical protein
MSDVTAAIISKLTALEARLAALEQRETTPLSGIEAGLTMTGPLAFGAGSAASPALHVVGDANTGFWQSAADNLDFSTGGTNRLNISSSGLLLSGLGSVGTPAIRIGDDANTGIWQSGANNLDFATDGANRLNLSSTGATVTGSVVPSAFVRLGPGSTLTVSSGGITVTGSRHYVDTEGGAATDDLYAISGGSTGDILILSSVSYTKVTTLKDGSGSNNLRLAGDFALSATDDMIMLMRIGDNWHEISRSNNT